MRKTKKENYFEQYEKNLYMFILFTFIIIGVFSLTFLLPKIYGIKGDTSTSTHKLTGINGDNISNEYKSGLSYVKKNDYPAALKYFESAVKSEPNNMNYLTELAVTYYRLKNYDMAIETYGKMINLDSGNAVPYNSIGNIYWIKKDYKNAELYFRKAIDADPASILSYNNLALMLDENDNKEEATEVLKQGIDANSNSSELKMTLRIITKDAETENQ